MLIFYSLLLGSLLVSYRIILLYCLHLQTSCLVLLLITEGGSERQGFHCKVKICIKQQSLTTTKSVLGAFQKSGAGKYIHVVLRANKN